MSNGAGHGLRPGWGLFLGRGLPAERQLTRPIGGRPQRITTVGVGCGQQPVGIGVLRVHDDSGRQPIDGGPVELLLNFQLCHQLMSLAIARPACQPIRRQGSGVIVALGQSGCVKQAEEGLAIDHGVTPDGWIPPCTNSSARTAANCWRACESSGLRSTALCSC